MADFMKANPKPPNGNTFWASRYASEIRGVVERQAARAPRTLQLHLGPSELGTPCDRQVAGKMAGLPHVNKVSDPWPSVLGTAAHDWLANAFTADNDFRGFQRWLAEQKVYPNADHPGTADLYDAQELAVVDHKVLGPTTMAPIVKNGPPRKYFVQLLLYGLGYLNRGLAVRRVVLVAYPRTKASLDELYVWEHEIQPEQDAALLEEVFADIARRKEYALALHNGQIGLDDIPSAPEDHECHFCLAGDTEVVTKQGIKPIRELSGGEHDLLIPSSARSKYGRFERVPVQSFGHQKLYELRLRRKRATKTVWATAEHRWVTDDGQVRTTADLTSGQRLATTQASPSTRPQQIPVAVAQGFTFGDGTLNKGNRPAALAVYGRSPKQGMLDYFQPAEVKKYSTPSGDKVDYIYGLPRSWKKLPSLDESRPFLLSWLAGYFAADGSVTKSGQCSISSADRDALKYVRDIAAVCGVGYGLITSKDRVGTGTRPTTLFRINLDVRGLPDWFWLLPHHDERAQQRKQTPSREGHWAIVSVKETDHREEVFCATVPGIEAFALADGLRTGNCPLYNSAKGQSGGNGCSGVSRNR